MNPTILCFDYLTQVGQLGTAGYDSFGDTSITTVATVSCYVYSEEIRQTVDSPAMSAALRNNLLLPISVRATTKVGDNISSVYDAYGNLVLSTARIKQIRDYNQWTEVTQFFHCELDLNLNG